MTCVIEYNRHRPSGRKFVATFYVRTMYVGSAVWLPKSREFVELSGVSHKQIDEFVGRVPKLSTTNGRWES